MQFKVIGIVAGVFLILLALGAAAIFFYLRYKINHIKDTGDLQARIDRVGERYVGRKGNVGLVVGVVKGDRVYLRGYGKKSRASAEAPDGSTIFEIGSVTKVFTAAAAQILADKKELALDDTIEKHLGGKVRIPETGRNVTLRQLATHTSGFPRLPTNLDEKVTDELNPYKDYARDDLYDYLSGCAGKKAEGTIEYSNLGMGLLGHALELATGKTYENVIKDEITGPPGMANTTVALSEEQKKLLAEGYNDAGAPNPLWDFQVLAGAGALRSNGEDMVRFLRANLDESGSGISASLLKIHDKQPEGEIGLGWHFPDALDAFLAGNDDFVWHNGMVGGYCSYIAIDRRSKIGVVLLSNTTDDVTKTGLMLLPVVRAVSFSEN